MKTLNVWEIYQNEAPKYAFFADRPSLERKNSRLMAYFAKFGIGIVFPLRSSPLATNFPVLLCTGIPCGTLIRSVQSQKRFPVSQKNSTYQVACFGRASTKIEDLEQLLADWETLATASRFNMLKLFWIIHRIHLFLQLLYLRSELLYRIMTFCQFLYWEFVNSQFLSSLQFHPLHEYF